MNLLCSFVAASLSSDAVCYCRILTNPKPSTLNPKPEAPKPQALSSLTLIPKPLNLKPFLDWVSTLEFRVCCVNMFQKCLSGLDIFSGLFQCSCRACVCRLPGLGCVCCGSKLILNMEGGLLEVVFWGC